MDFVLNINVCRVCMKSEHGKCLLKHVKLKSKFTYATQLTINEKDNLPTIICEKCVSRLRTSYDFIKLAQDSDSNLKTFVSKVNDDFMQVKKTGTRSAAEDCVREEEQLLTLHVEDQSDDVADDDESTNADSEVAVSVLAQQKATPKKISPRNDYSKQHKANETLVVQVSKDTSDDGSAFLLEESEHMDDSGFLVLNDSEFVNTNTKLKAELCNNVEYSEQDLNLSNNSDTEFLAETEIEMQQEEEHLNGTSGYLQEYEELLESDATMCAEFVSQEEETTEEEGERNFLRELDLYENDENILPDDVAPLEMHDVLEELSPQAATDELAQLENEQTEQQVDDKSLKARNKRKRRTNPSTGTEARFYCNKCNKDFSTRQNLNRHTVTHEGKKPFVCKECGKAFSQNGSLKQHMFTHTGERPHICPTCNRGFTQWKSLAFHMRRHTGEKPFPCEHCGIAFRQKDGLKTHIMKRHMITEQLGGTATHACVICKKILANKNLLQAHMKRHLNNHKDVGANVMNDTDVLLTTDESDPSVAAATPEIYLEVVNEEEESLLPEIDTNELGIGDILASSTHVVDLLATSAAVPGRAKKFQCRKCFKCFAIIKNLVRHLSIHKAELFKCQNCNLAFESKYAQKFHRIRDHKETGINLNECEECQLSFECDQDLNEHLRGTHGLNCPQCPTLSFKTRIALLEHQIDHEDMDAEQ